MVRPDDEVFAITSAGGVIRTRASEVKQTGRETMGVRLMNLAPGDSRRRTRPQRGVRAESVDDVVDLAVDSPVDEGSGNE